MTENYEDFISTVSHELRTPLTSIRGFADTMLNSWDRLDEDSKKKFLGIIKEQSDRLINMVENILSVTKLHSQSERIILKDIPVRPTVEKVVQLLKTQYKDKNFIVDEKINTPNILADEDKFQQAIMNIIENACKYSNNNDIWINVGFGEDENFVAINVTNLGLGIDERDYEKIFTKFSRIDNPLTRKVQGSGLGLYITKNILEKMGGTICVKSENIDANISKITFTIDIPSSDIEKQARAKCIR